MLTRDSARTASRSELRDRPRSAARSASRGSRSPARSVPDVIMALTFSIASSVTAKASHPPPRPLHAVHQPLSSALVDPMFAPSMAYRRAGPLTAAAAGVPHRHPVRGLRQHEGRVCRIPGRAEAAGARGTRCGAAGARRPAPPADPAPRPAHRAARGPDRDDLHPHPAGGQPAHRRAQAGRPPYRAPRGNPPPLRAAPRVARAGPRAALRVLARRPEPPEEGRRDGPSPATEEVVVTAEIRNDVIVATEHIKAPPEVVFPYFTDPALIVTWIGDRAELDPQPGGVFSLDMGEALARGAYITVDPPYRVVFSWGIPGSDTMVVLTHRGLPSTHISGHRAGWEHQLGRLPAAAG